MVINVLIPASMALLMIGVGTTVGPAEIRREWAEPRVFVAGLLSQLIALPLLALGLLALSRPDPALAMGLLLVAACPGGVFSNLMTHLARGRTALSVALTAVSTTAAVLTIPLWTTVGIHWLGLPSTEGSLVADVPKLAMMTTIPVLLGIGLRAVKPRWCDRMARPFSVASVVFLVGVASLIGIGRHAAIWQGALAIGPTAIALSAASASVGATIALAARANRAAVVTISLETGIQNAGLALAIALSSFPEAIRDTVALPAMLYLFLTFVPAAVLISIGRRVIPEATVPPLP